MVRLAAATCVGMREVGDHVADLAAVRGSSRPSGIRDEGDGRRASISERSRINRFGLRLKRDRARRLRLDHSIQHAAVMHRRDHHPEVGAHRGARVDDVLQQIIEIVAARAGQVGTDFAANAVKLVAGAADPVKHVSPAAKVGLGERLPSPAFP